MTHKKFPSQCIHWNDGKCGLTPHFIQTDKGLALNVWCRGVCPNNKSKRRTDNER